MNFIDECNRLRLEDDPSLDELCVDFDLMLVSAISSAISEQAGYTEGHLFYETALQDEDLFYYLQNASGRIDEEDDPVPFGESLAWGYEDPYDGWFYEERELYYEHEDEYIDDYEAASEKYGTISHYLNIVSPYFNSTGFAMTAGGTAEQSFGNYKYASIDTDEFREGLDVITEWAETELAKVQQRLAEIEAPIKTLKADADAKKQAYDAAAASRSSAISAVNKAKSEAEAAGAALKAANKKAEDAAKDVEAKQAALAIAESELNGLQNTKLRAVRAQSDIIDNAKNAAAVSGAEVERIIAELDELAASLETAKSVKASKDETLASVNEDLEKLDGRIAELQAEVASAEKVLKAATEEKETAAADYTEKTKALLAAKSDFEAKTVAVEAPKAAFDNANLALADANAKLTASQIKYDGIANKYADVIKASEVMGAAQSKLSSALVSKSEAESQVAQLTAKCAEAKTAKENAFAALESVRPIDRNDPATYAEYESIVQLVAAYEKAKEELDIAKDNLEKAEAYAEPLLEEYNQAKSVYSIALADYTIAKAEHDKEQAAKNPAKDKSDKSPKTSDDFDYGLGAAGAIGAALIAAGTQIKRKED